MFESRDDWSGRRFAIFGLGKTGEAALKYFSSRGAELWAIDSAEPSKKSHLLKLFSHYTDKIHFFLGGREPSDWSQIELAIVSPGINLRSRQFDEIRKRGIPLRGALDFAAEIAQKPVIAVTGTAGKSTTVSIIGEIFKAEGIKSFVGGNLGTPLFEWLHQEEDAEVLILECSSFQLELARAIRAKIALLTNFSPNHLDRHGTMEEYARCKARLFQLMPKNSYAIAPFGDREAFKIVRCSPGNIVFFSDKTEEGVHAWDRGDSFVLQYPKLPEIAIPWDGFKLRGTHNRLNALAAALTAYLWGVSKDSIRRGITSFSGLPHRLQYVGEFRGLSFFDDSKATTPEAVLRSILSFDSKEPIHLLLGGKAKSSGFSVLRREFGRRIRNVYLFGSSAPDIRRELNLSEKFLFSNLESAFNEAVSRAQKGDIVLLSPGCASFDQYENFIARGRHFQRLVETIKDRQFSR